MWTKYKFHEYRFETESEPTQVEVYKQSYIINKTFKI